ncbi:MAG: 50S ribosomal protein L25/general stress protein Ctc [Hyphomonadaceae bacterium]|nr:MAG: large subunit ribosomal protein L25 [Caulobacteraceae bacterium]MBT9445254.1 50S ribosomal protein L25/general stress protein Ctc [Hyphomonadaceae bacterium]TPW07955.1 MAG: large subunit ribosomal protein L25 [Alphaproteobacteria bacterium]
MAGIVLTVDVREKTGTGGARATRRLEQVPGILYGGERGPIPIEVSKKELVKAVRSGKFISHMITLDHKGEKQPVIPRAIQFHPVTDEPLHVDLYRVEENSVIDVNVPVHFKNHADSPGLKRGGVLNVVEHTIRLKVKAVAIPEEVVIDLTGLDVGAVIHLSALTLPAGATPVVKDRDLTIASIGGRMAEAAEPAAEAAPAAAAPAADAKGGKKD